MRYKAITGIMLTLLLICMFCWTGTPAIAWSNVNKTLNHTAGAEIQYIFYANDSAGQLSNTGVQTFWNGRSWWDKLVADAKWSWNWGLNITETWSNYGNLTAIYSYEDGVRDHLYPHLIGASLAMYKMTGNTTYLDYARDSCDDMLNKSQHSTTKLIGEVKRSDGTIDNTQEQITALFLLSVIHLAFEDSNYVDTVNELCNAIIQYTLEVNNNHALPLRVYPDGSNITNPVKIVWRRGSERIVESFLWAYLLTGNTTYRKWARDIIVDWWEARNTTTNLIYDMINAETGVWHDNYDTFTRHYSQGSFLRACCFYYFFDQNSTIYNIIENNAKAICNYIYITYSGYGYWRYKTEVGDGSSNLNILEGNWASMDYAMQLASEITSNSTLSSDWRSKSLENFDTSFQGEGKNRYDDFIIHGTNPDGSAWTDESCMWFGFNTIVPVWAWFYRNGKVTDQGNNRMFRLYNQTVRRHAMAAEYQQGNYGYRRTIDAGMNGGSYGNVSDGKADMHNLASASILPWIQFRIRPSGGVNITWVTLPNKKLYQTWHGEDFMHNDHHCHWFQNVTFDLSKKKISFDEITGSGTVTFNETIVSVKKDGTFYSNFSGNVLNTVSGSRSYVVYFKQAPIYNINTGLGYVTIQEAINAPETLDGHTILVDAGTYYEHVVVNKTVSLIGGNRGTTIVDGNGTGNVIFVRANNVVISNFTIRNGGPTPNNGILIYGCRNCTIIGNIIANNTGNGMGITDATGNTLRDNSLINNTYNFGVWSTRLEGYAQDIDPSNTVDGKPIYYWVNQKNKSVPLDAGFVGIVNSTNIIIKDLDIRNNEDGVLLAYTTNSIIRNVTIDKVINGILLYGSSGNIIIENAITNSPLRALHMDYSSNNFIYHNNFINNVAQVYSYGSVNVWDNGYPSGGNYWSNHVCTGNPSNGSQPYVMDENNIDHYPFQDPNGWVIPGDINGDEVVDIMDVLIVGLAFGSFPGHPNWNPIADLNNDGITDIFDLLIIGVNFGKKLPL